MIPASTEYVRAANIEQAVQLLAEGKGEHRILAGGHSLLPMMKFRLSQPRLLIDIAHVSGLREIVRTASGLCIGAMVRHNDIVDSKLVAEHLPLMAEAAATIADVLVRNRGTIGGSCAHADPSADWPAVLLALGARFIARGQTGARVIEAEHFFQDLFQTALEPDEILEAIEVPSLAPETRAAYVKERHPASGYAVAGAAVLIRVEDGHVVFCRVAVTGVAAAAYRAKTLEKALLGKPFSSELMEETAMLSTDLVDVLSDQYASSDYRRHLAHVVTRRALKRAFDPDNRSTKQLSTPTVVADAH